MEQPPPYTPQDGKLNYVPPGAAPPGPVGFQGVHPPPPNVYFTSPVTSQNTVILGPEIIITSLGPNPQRFTCPFCHQTSTTRIVTEANTKTHLFALFMCIFLCWPCCVVPYCVDSCQSKNHYCGNCGAFVGSFDD